MTKLKIITDSDALQNGFLAGAMTSEDSRVDGGDNSGSDFDSLFDETEEHPPLVNTEAPATRDVHEQLIHPAESPASRLGPPILGLYFDPYAGLPEELAKYLLQTCLATYFQNENVNQVMLFERVVPDSPGTHPVRKSTVRHRLIGLRDADPHVAAMSFTNSSNSSLPPFLTDLLSTLSTHLRPLLPPAAHEMLFPLPGSPPRARQVIINFYRPGEGIAPHVDLLKRFDDGIIGVCLGSGCVMRFAKADTQRSAEADVTTNGEGTKDAWSVFLPHGSVYVMSGEARYGWTHGIDGRQEDWVQDETCADTGSWVPRSKRVSITFRWLLPGANIVGGSEDATAQY